MMRRLAVLSLGLALAGCNSDPAAKPAPAPSASASTAPQAAAPAPAAGLDAMAGRDPAPGQAAPVSDPIGGPMMQLQVVLDRLGFTPGVIDGKPGQSTKHAITGFQEANNIDPSGELDEQTKAALDRWKAIPATRTVTIPDDFAAGPFTALPKGEDEQAKMPALGYVSLDQKLASRFHTTVDTLRTLNPDAARAAPSEAAALDMPSAAPSDGAVTPQPGPASVFRAGQQVRVPNTGSQPVVPGSVKDADWAATLLMLGVGSEQPKVTKIVVSKSQGTLRALDGSGHLVGMYTATMGSVHDPLPLGQWKVNGVSRNPKFHFNPALFWDAKANETKAMLPPGPNGPVGVVWIDLNKPHYGIHGTPNPQLIGRTESHGCVRLTNWDAARLAQMVSPGTQVLFEK
jgi:lipoprotein-anchoring transpeptidase ErfK/SrfK